MGVEEPGGVCALRLNANQRGRRESGAGSDWLIEKGSDLRVFDEKHGVYLAMAREILCLLALLTFFKRS